MSPGLPCFLANHISWEGGHKNTSCSTLLAILGIYPARSAKCDRGRFGFDMESNTRPNDFKDEQCRACKAGSNRTHSTPNTQNSQNCFIAGITSLNTILQTYGMWLHYVILKKGKIQWQSKSIVWAIPQSKSSHERSRMENLRCRKWLRLKQLTVTPSHNETTKKDVLLTDRKLTHAAISYIRTLL